ncbi:hypothetical protein RBY4I_2638 [Rhodobacterales bacterium Y4I]|nr:hypothetical protein RBY4I_2638 [Rhodobacterales bacterium Y4I]
MIRSSTLPGLRTRVHLAIFGEVSDRQPLGNKTFRKMIHEIMRLSSRTPPGATAVLQSNARVVHFCGEVDLRPL